MAEHANNGFPELSSSSPPSPPAPILPPVPAPGPSPTGDILATYPTRSAWQDHYGNLLDALLTLPSQYTGLMTGRTTLQIRLATVFDFRTTWIKNEFPGVSESQVISHKQWMTWFRNVDIARDHVSKALEIVTTRMEEYEKFDQTYKLFFGKLKYILSLVVASRTLHVIRY